MEGFLSPGRAARSDTGIGERGHVGALVGPSHRRSRRLAAVIACLVCAAALLTGSSVAGTVAGKPLLVIQMNLCDSGLAGCYTGRAVAEAAAVIRAEAPDLVTLNEVCQGDVYALRRTLAGLYRDGGVAWAFKAAGDRRTGAAFRCRNGQPYGVGLLAHVPAPYRGYTTYSGLYPTQDTGDPEERAWVCVSATGHFHACTTHLADSSSTVALGQCGYLLDTAIPVMRAEAGDEPTVLAGDFNLRYHGSPDVSSCVPSGYLRTDDGAVQQIVATADFLISSRRSIDMKGATDHPGLLVALTGIRQRVRLHPNSAGGRLN